MILACDTSSVVCSVAISHHDEVIFEREAIGGQIHIEKLAPFIDEALHFCASNGHTLTALAIAIGPGSFNGLRIGLGTMKALALAKALPLIAIPSTDALALGMQNQISGLSRAVIFSHRNFVHFADYDLGGAEQVTTPQFHYESWDQLAGSDIVNYFGTADRGFAQWLEEDETATPVREKFHPIHANAGLVARLAESRASEELVDLDELEPLYNATYEAKKWVPPTF